MQLSRRPRTFELHPFPPADPTVFYVAYASGGLWKTENNGQSFAPLFDHQAVMTMGDIAVDWDDGGMVWVGTGEKNSSRSSYAGAGVYRSTDGGETWTRLTTEGSGFPTGPGVGRIGLAIYPENPNILYALLDNQYRRCSDEAIPVSTP